MPTPFKVSTPVFTTYNAVSTSGTEYSVVSYVGSGYLHSVHVGVKVSGSSNMEYTGAYTSVAVTVNSLTSYSFPAYQFGGTPVSEVGAVDQMPVHTSSGRDGIRWIRFRGVRFTTSLVVAVSQAEGVSETVRAIVLYSTT